MSTIAGLRLENIGCFRGSHALALTPSIYAVLAKLDTDSERSNFCGKSLLCESPLFVLHGWTNPTRGYLADDWISDGEKSGSGTVTFDDGYSVTRSKVAGKREELSTSTGAKQDRAQEEINARFGLDLEDILATSYFPQRETARFVLARPGARLEIVSGWLRLGKLEAAYERAREILSERVKDSETGAKRFAVLEEFERAELAGETLESLKAALAPKNAVLETSRADAENARRAWRTAIEIAEAKKRVAEYQAIAARGKVLQEEMRSGCDEGDLIEQNRRDQVEVNEALNAANLASDEARKKLAVVRGKFDGVCPVAGIQCPAKDEINANSARALLLADQASAASVKASAELSEVRALAEKSHKALSGFNAKRVELQTLIARAKVLKPQIEAAMKAREYDVDKLAREVEAAEMLVRDLSDDGRALAARIANVEKVRKERFDLMAGLGGHNDRIATARAAVSIYGRNGAQRRIAESALARIEHDANVELSKLGHGLSVALRWAREGKDPAKTCEACGQAFPTSARVKVCERCGGPRGLHLVHRLDVLLSSQSGAAEDLAGIALQLSASRWLREDRGSLFEFASLDEPTGQLDRAVRRSFTANLPRMLAASGIRQAFVVSHSSDVLDALPSRIEVLSDGRWSRPTVVG